MTTKEFKTWIIINYKTGQFRIVKKKPTTMKASEIPIDLRLNLVIPETPVIQARGEVVLSESKVKEMVLETLEE